MRRFEITSGVSTAEFEADETLLVSAVGVSLKEREENLQKFYDRYVRHALAALAAAEIAG